jgi:hypothetical protein
MFAQVTGQVPTQGDLAFLIVCHPFAIRI